MSFESEDIERLKKEVCALEEELKQTKTERGVAIAYLEGMDCPCCTNGECPIKHMIIWNGHRDECLRLPEECWPELIRQETVRRKARKEV